MECYSSSREFNRSSHALSFLASEHGVRLPVVRVTTSWRDLTGKRRTEQDIADLVKGFNRLSALISLARINILLAVDRFRRDDAIMIKVQGFLAGTFFDDDVLSLLKQVLLLARYVLIYGAVCGGRYPEKDPVRSGSSFRVQGANGHGDQ